MTAVGYISDTEETMNASRPNFQPDSAAAFKLSERSPFPPVLSAKDWPVEQTQVLNVHRIRKIDHHPAEGDQDSAPDSFSNTKIGSTAMVIWIFQTRVKATVSQTINPIQR